MKENRKDESIIVKYIKLTILWFIAIVVSYLVFKIQRITGPTYPYRGHYFYQSQKFDYKLIRSSENLQDAKIEIPAPEKTNGILYYHRLRTDEPWSAVKMSYQDGVLYGFIPKQPPAGKVEYYLVLTLPDKIIRIPERNSIVIRFKGHVPLWLLIPHIILMILSFVFVIKAFLDTLYNLSSKNKNFLYGTYSMVLGGLVFGPIVQKLAFGAYWTGWPFGGDWTDSKVGFIVIILIIANFILWYKKTAKSIVFVKAAIIVATIAMLIIYLIPHSFRGSDLDYKSGVVKTGHIPNN